MQTAKQTGKSIKGVGVVGFPQDIGASRRGVDMGPYALRAEGLLTVLKPLVAELYDYGNIACVSMEDIAFAGDHYKGEDTLRFLPPIRQNLIALKERVQRIVDDGLMPLCIGGDHSMAMGSVAGLPRVPGKTRGLLWIDAHGDFNTPQTTPSGNIHGMPLAIITGRGDQRLLDIGPFPCVSDQHVVVFGARDLDPGEIENFKASKIRIFTTRDILEHGFFACFNQAIKLVSEGTDSFHLSFDMDAIDPMFCPGTGTAVPGGLTNREALYIMERCFETGMISSIDLVEVNPALDVNNKTGLFAVELLARALGKTTV